MENNRSVTWLYAFLIVMGVTLIGCVGAGDDVPEAYKKRCIKCHGTPNGLKATVGPDLVKSEYTLDQFIMQVKNGSRWDKKPVRKDSFKRKKMPAQPMVTEAQIKEIFEYVRKRR
ncbi:hypothetical protein MNBD_NITROSPINAE02-1834 [hydrothermal vent metagenome]|uniref:Cytochrome c domain-containing protein n=1 Tax=hydrothermal vent metagenome TaxID=652676 RepID=A0A3B1C6N7_9ZZZZ